MLEMMKSSKDSHEELEDDDEVTNTVKVDGKNMEKSRSKHSQTEQRRRCKINERFQILRDLLPQTDQKRDKASFLLEVIGYIHFLQDKLNYYEGSYQDWRTEPTKLTPWQKNEHVSAEKFTGQSHVTKSCSGLQNNTDVSPIMLTSAQSSVQSELGSALVQKQIDHLLGLAMQVAPLNMQPPGVFESVGTDGIATTQPLPDSISNAVSMDSQPQPEIWQCRDTTTCSISNNTLNILDGKRKLTSISNAYSQGILDKLTQALQSSGMDVSQASISVQVDVGNRANTNSMPASSKEYMNHSSSNQVIRHAQASSSGGDFKQAHKRLRTEDSVLF